jgi:two-component system, cell cycle sensor histidine kinase and response regulator CckA
MNRLTTIISNLAHRFRVDQFTQASPQRILIVDDDASVRRFLHAVLISAGYHTVVASDGVDALATFEREGPFDVVVTDVMMPQMRGEELARRVRYMASAIKVLYVTGYADALFAEKVRLWEDEAFLEKPFTPDGVLEAVSLLVNGQLRQKAVWGNVPRKDAVKTC